MQTVTHSNGGLSRALLACSLALVVLLAAHPHDGGHLLSEVLESEARHQLANGVIHGGTIVVLSGFVACFVLLSQRLGPARAPVVAAMVAFSIGSGALLASLVVDGFVVPSIAARASTAGLVADAASKGPLIVLCGTLIRFLMPMGIAFQQLALAAWSMQIVGAAAGARRVLGLVGVAGPLAIAIAAVAAPPVLEAAVTIAAMVTLAAWSLGVAVLLRHLADAPRV